MHAVASLLAAVCRLSATSPPAPISLASAACAADEGAAACWTVSSDDGKDGAILDGHGSIAGVAALVPGEIHDDLMRGGVLGDIWYGNGSMLERGTAAGGFLSGSASWVGWRSWRFTREFSSPAASVGDVGSARWRRWLCFDGVEYNCTVRLNNVTVGHHVGQFEPFEWDVTELLRPAGQLNQLEVRTHPLLDNMTEFGAQVFGTTTYTGQVSCWLNRHAPLWMGRTMYGWDFVPALFSAGIAGDVSLRSTAALPASDAATTLRAYALVIIPRLEPPYTSARLEVALEIHLGSTAASWPSGPSLLTVHWTVSKDGTPVAIEGSVSSFNVSASGGREQKLRANLTLPHPDLWWPNGYGSQPMYSLAASVSADETVMLDRITRNFGVRELTVGANPHLAGGWSYIQYGPEHTETIPWGWGSWQARVAAPIPPNATAWQIRINGRPIFARGGNWIPRDQLFGRGVRERNRTTQILRAAQHAGFTWMRVWGGGLIEDQHFYDECDRLGLMLLQEFPHAGCSPGGPGDSLVNYTQRLPVDDAQTRMGLKQLVNHPSIVRYNYANEFYLNSSVSPLIAKFLATAREVDNSRPVHEANPTCVAIRHGPYTFGAGSYATYGPGSDCGDGTVLSPGMAQGEAGCAGQGDNGGNPFEWDEFGATGLADIDTLHRIIPPTELTAGWRGSPSASWAFHRMAQWGNVGGYRPVFSAAGIAAPTLVEEVRWSQFMQAEGLRFSFQAHRRAKPHRSAANSWTFNEPWPNAAHGSMLSFSGVPKMAYYYTRAAMAMVDVSLLYSGLTVPAGSPLANSSASIWLDSELDVSLSTCELEIEYFDSGGTGATAVLATERHRLPLLSPASGAHISAPGVLAFTPSARMVGTSVLLIRTSLHCSKPIVHASNVYTFGVIGSGATQAANATAAATGDSEEGVSAYRLLPGLIPADRMNYTAALQGHALCEARCNATAACVGFTTDQTPTNCWLYDAVHALVSSPPDVFHLKPGRPVPPHTPAPPPPPLPPPRVAPLAPLANATFTNLSLRLDSPAAASNGTIAFSLTNSGDHVALFARLALRAAPDEVELAYALFSENFLCLIPGEEARLTVTMAGVASDGPLRSTLVLCVEAWNAAERCIGSGR